MKKLLCLFLIVSAVASAQPVSLLPRIDSVIRGYYDAGQFEGVALVSHQGRVILHQAYGLADSSRNNDTTMGYQIGSLTKQFTAVALLKLEEEGKLSVNDRLSKYFPQLKYADSITLYQLVTHTSGLHDYTSDSAFWDRSATRSWSLDQLLALIKDKPLDFSPGSKFSYCNSGYVLLGYIIGKVSGKTYEGYIRETIFRPLGMNRSGFRFPTASNRAKGYYTSGVSLPSVLIDSTASHAAGAIYSTSSDLYRWVRAIHDQKIIRPASWKTAVTPFRGGYAYGLIVDKLYGMQRVWHNGGIHGFVSHIDYYPETNSAVILLSNHMNSDVMKLSNTLAAALAGKAYKLPTVRKEVKLPDSTLSQYPGTYPLTADFALTITLKDGQLMAQATGQENFPLYAEKPDHFFYRVVDAQIVFQRNAEGKVEVLVLHQNGAKMKGVRKTD